MRKKPAPREPGPMPMCAANCGRRLKRRWRAAGRRARFCCMACVPLALRQAAGHKGGTNTGYLSRRRLFATELARLTVDGKRITREELLAVFQTIYARGRASLRQERCKADKKARAA